MTKKSTTSSFLDRQDESRILEEFPKFELSYEEIVHKKVQANCYALIPSGKPCFAWFTIFNQSSVCFIIDISRESVEMIMTSFDESLTIGDGTILRGVLFRQAGAQLFAIEDIHLYKGDPTLNPKCSTVKFGVFKKMLSTELGKNAFTSKCIVFGLPIMHSNLSELMNIEKTQTLYRVKYIQFATVDRHGSCKLPIEKYVHHEPVINQSAKERTVVKDNKTDVVKTNIAKTNPAKTNAAKIKVFSVTPEIQPDIYRLVKDGLDCGVACIPNYKTSAMMNKLFRNLKENDNLDALEESDEEEFENEDPHKFVYLERTLNMTCEYNTKFKKWVPISVVK
jgi:hypothetical protein